MISRATARAPKNPRRRRRRRHPKRTHRHLARRRDTPFLRMQPERTETHLRPRPQIKRPRRSFVLFVPSAEKPITLPASAETTVSPTYLSYRTNINSLLANNFTIVARGSKFTPPSTVILFVSSYHIGYLLIKFENLVSIN